MILITGMPRSGSTAVFDIISQASVYTALIDPDNLFRSDEPGALKGVDEEGASERVVNNLVYMQRLAAEADISKTLVIKSHEILAALPDVARLFDLIIFCERNDLIRWVESAAKHGNMYHRAAYGRPPSFLGELKNKTEAGRLVEYGKKYKEAVIETYFKCVNKGSSFGTKFLVIDENLDKEMFEDLCIQELSIPESEAKRLSERWNP